MKTYTESIEDDGVRRLLRGIPRGDRERIIARAGVHRVTLPRSRVFATVAGAHRATPTGAAGPMRRALRSL